MSNPTLVLVHGFWANSLHWQYIIPLLMKANFKVKAVEIPLTSLSDDVQRITQIINQIEGPVILVGHSYGGVVITQAGNHDNVSGLVYIAAFAPDQFESAAIITELDPPQAIENLYADVDGYFWIKEEKYHQSFCQDLNELESMTFAVSQKAPLANTFANTVSKPAWKTKPSWYQISTQDCMISLTSQRRMAQRLNAKEVLELNTSHASLISKPEDIAAFIIKAAKKI